MQMYADQLSVITHTMNVIFLVLQVSFVQIGGVPKPKTIISWCAFIIWLITYFTQWLLSWISLVLMHSAYQELGQSSLGGCMRTFEPLARLNPLAHLDLVWYTSYIVHPIILSRMLFVLLYTHIISIGTRYARRYDSTVLKYVLIFFLNLHIVPFWIAFFLTILFNTFFLPFRVPIGACGLLPLLAYAAVFRWGRSEQDVRTGNDQGSAFWGTMYQKMRAFWGTLYQKCAHSSLGKLTGKLRSTS
jgi:hypothetical protein